MNADDGKKDTAGDETRRNGLLILNVPKTLRRSFNARCKANGETMRDALVRFMQGYRC